MRRASILAFILSSVALLFASDVTDLHRPWDAIKLVSFNRGDASDVSWLAQTPTVGGGATFPAGYRTADFSGASTAVISYPSDARMHGVPFTVCFWTRIDNSVTRVNLVGRCTVGFSPEQYRGWYIHFIGTGAGSYGPVFATNKNGSNFKAATGGSPTTYADGTWHHWAWTCTDANSFAAWKVYLNGVDTAFGQISAGTVSDISNSEPLTLGGQTTANQTGYLDGALDDVRIYSVVKSAAEIGAIYAEGVGKSRP